MSEHDILVEGKPHKVKVLKVDQDSRFLVKVDETTYEVQPANDLGYRSPASLNINGKLCEVEVTEVRKNIPFTVKINGKSYRVQYQAARKPSRETPERILLKPSKPRFGKAIPEKGVVTAALPGRVVLLKVTKGDSVEVDDTLCILEAMKMENEIAAPVAGIIKQVMVSEGALVNKGDELFHIEQCSTLDQKGKTPT